MIFYSLLLVFFCNCFAMENSQSPFVWNNSDGMKDLRKKILKHLKPYSNTIFKQIAEKIKITVPFLLTYGISKNGKFYATFSHQDNKRFLEVWNLETQKKFKSIEVENENFINDMLKLVITNDASIIVIQGNNAIYSINLAQHNNLDKLIDYQSVPFSEIQEMFFTKKKLIILSKLKEETVKKLDAESAEDNTETAVFEIKNENLFQEEMVVIRNPTPKNKKIQLINKDTKYYCCTFPGENDEKINYLAAEIMTKAIFFNEDKTLHLGYLNNNKVINCPFLIIRDIKSLKPLNGIVTPEKKIIDTFATDNDNNSSIIRFNITGNTAPQTKGLNFSLLSNPADVKHVSNYFVQVDPDNKSVNLYSDQALTFLIKRSDYAKDFSVKNSNLNDAQSFLLLALEEAAQDDNPYVELKEIMKSAYNTMPRQIRKLYEHHVIIKD